MQVLTLQMKKVGDSNSDNDEDCNKSSSTYSFRDRHFLAWKPSKYGSSTRIKASTLDRKVCQKYMSEDSWYQSKTNYLQHTNQFQSYHQQAITNHHVNNNLKTKQWCNLHRYQGHKISNEGTSTKVKTFQLINSTVQEMITDRYKVLRSGEHAER